MKRTTYNILVRFTALLIKGLEYILKITLLAVIVVIVFKLFGVV